MDIHISESALRYGITDGEIHCVLTTVVFDAPILKYANKFLLIGFNRNGSLIEIMYDNKKDGSFNIFHAMKCRKEFRKYVEESGYYV